MRANTIHYRLKPNEKVVYFRNLSENAVFRSEKGEHVFVKFKGEKEFQSHEKSDLVFDTVMEKEIDFIDKETYDNW